MVRFCLCVLFLLAPVFAAAAGEKRPPWTEVRSPHFSVFTNAGEGQGRRVARHFEQIRALFQSGLRVRVAPEKSVVILALKDEASFREILPGYWETPGGVRPAGLFQSAAEKDYVAVRLDAGGESPYHTVYHEYVHMLVHANLPRVPLWLNEGLAELFGQTALGEKETGVGGTNAASLALLRRSGLLPLEELFSVDRSSQHYNEAGPANRFYAQCWALTHLLAMGEPGAPGQLLDYLGFLKDGIPEAEARRRAFGVLQVLEEKLAAYLRRAQFPVTRMKSPEEFAQDAFTAREISAADAAAVRGEFLLRTGRPGKARAAFEEALRLDPNLAAAQEGMGFLHLQEGERAAAARRFARAVELDSSSYLAHYYHALLTAEAARDGAAMSAVESSLRRALELNPDFAPAYASLSGASLQRDLPMEKTLRAARRAAELEPAIAARYLNLAQILLTLGRVNEARQAADQLFALAKTSEERAAATLLLDGIRRFLTTETPRQQQ